MSEESREMTDGEYLEMSNHLKKLYDEMEEKNAKLMFDKLDLKKVLTTVYGLVRIIDNMVDAIHGVPTELEILVQTLRAYLSDEMDTHIFNIKAIDINELDIEV